jgi:hypothetical protein
MRATLNLEVENELDQSERLAKKGVTTYSKNKMIKPAFVTDLPSGTLPSESIDMFNLSTSSR